MSKLFVLLMALVVIACRKKGSEEGKDLTQFAYAPTAYTLVPPAGLPDMPLPTDNPMTEEGIALGRRLFYDPILSLDSTISCESCHKQNKVFTDGTAFSTGIDGQVGFRSSMSLVNVGYNWVPGRKHNFMWDGRFETLEDQAINGPIVDPVEMNNTWENVEETLRRHPTYPKLFREAFGIRNTSELKIELVGKALAQFQRTLNAAFSKYDQDRYHGLVYLTPQEEEGLALFDGYSNNGALIIDAHCSHCHSYSDNKALFASNEFSNNGLDSAVVFSDFLDFGFGAVTNTASQNGLFRGVGLRNVALTAPYMHDGRFQTLEEVLDHYAVGGHPSPTRDVLMTTMPNPPLNAIQKAAIIAFLHTLTDTSYIDKEAWSNPF
jgi:cytochrome c peroxidase